MLLIAQIQRVSRRLRAGEDGFTMIALMGALLVTTLLVSAAFAAVDNDQPTSRANADSKIAYAAAEAGVNDYAYHLSQDQAYWAKCTNVAAPNAVNQKWNGVGTDPRTWRSVPGSNARYTIELLPNPNVSSCDSNTAEASMIDPNSGTFRIRVTGAADATHRIKRGIMVTFKRKGFLDYLYFTNYETSDPAWYTLDTFGYPTSPDLVTWANTTCARYYRRDGLHPNAYRDQELYDYGPGSPTNNPNQGAYYNNQWNRWTDDCTAIQFAPADVIRGPLHTNDELLTCGAPTFGRNANDRIEVSAPKNDAWRTNFPGWRGSSGCSGNNPNFLGTMTVNAPTLSLPPSDSALKTVATSAYVFRGKTFITLGSSGSMTVSNTTMGLNAATMTYPANGVIYVDNDAATGCNGGYNAINPYGDSAGCGDAFVRGSYNADLTIATKKDVVITGNTTKSGDVMLGLIADNFVRLYHPVTHNDPTNPYNCTNQTPATDPLGIGTLSSVQIDAAILSLAHSFTVDNYYCGAALGTLTVNGTIGQNFRGPVGTGGNSIGTGYTKLYSYDDRLRFRSPPHFIDPVQSAWRVLRYTEQINLPG